MSTVSTGRVTPLNLDFGFNGEGMLSRRAVSTRMRSMSISRIGRSPNSGTR